MDYYNEIKTKLIDSEIYEKVKDFSKERNRVIAYYEIGKLLNKAGSIYGENIIGKYSKLLMVEVGKKYNPRTLFRMRKFYNVFSNEKLTPLVTQLTWTHYLLLISINDSDKIIYYINLCVKFNLTKRDLEQKIKSNDYERIPKLTRINIVNKTECKLGDLIREPIIIRKFGNYEFISEKILHKLILEDIENFMRELGDCFSFIGSEYKIKLGDNYNYIDLLFYNIKFKCYVVIELKITELRKEYIGQIQTYMNYIDVNVKTSDECKTIGIIIIKKNNKYVMEYCSDERIIAKEYKIT
ncbi:MAG: PDDEXK nuclease domain-containing protein [Bacilli bacterium]|nr:PDDEXK nuclease domain-containing protein [Bacilli bacterium]